MADTRDAHVVEIPVDEEHHRKQLIIPLLEQPGMASIQHHPLMEISRSPGHLLLLKLWQREEEVFARRMALKELRMDLIRRDIFQLCCFFLVFHSFFFIVTFTASQNEGRTCRRWWIPSLMSAVTSMVLVFLVQVNLFRFWKVRRRLMSERSDNRALTRCVQELRMKGSGFDLCKEPISGKRMKSSSVEIKWRPLTWFSHYYITVLLILVAGLSLSASKLVLCGI